MGQGPGNGAGTGRWDRTRTGRPPPLPTGGHGSANIWLNIWSTTGARGAAAVRDAQEPPERGQAPVKPSSHSVAAPSSSSHPVAALPMSQRWPQKPKRAQRESLEQCAVKNWELMGIQAKESWGSCAFLRLACWKGCRRTHTSRDGSCGTQSWHHRVQHRPLGAPARLLAMLIPQLSLALGCPPSTNPELPPH